MTTTQADLAAARKRHADAHTGAQAARDRVADLRRRLSEGDEFVTAAELAEALADVDRCDLLVQAADGRLQTAGAAERAEHAEAEISELSAALKERGRAVQEARDRLADVADEFVTAALQYDHLVDYGVGRMNTIATVGPHPRLEQVRSEGLRVDGIRLRPCGGPNLLVASLLDAFRDLGTPKFALDNLKLLADGARELPTT